MSFKDAIKGLEKEKDQLLGELKNLEDKKLKNLISKEDYDFQKNKIERALVEIMDRLVQFRYVQNM